MYVWSHDLFTVYYADFISKTSVNFNKGFSLALNLNFCFLNISEFVFLNFCDVDRILFLFYGCRLKGSQTLTSKASTFLECSETQGSVFFNSPHMT